jgi:hypothetical protein
MDVIILVDEALQGRSLLSPSHRARVRLRLACKIFLVSLPVLSTLSPARVKRTEKLLISARRSWGVYDGVVSSAYFSVASQHATRILCRHLEPVGTTLWCRRCHRLQSGLLAWTVCELPILVSESFRLIRPGMILLPYIAYEGFLLLVIGIGIAVGMAYFEWHQTRQKRRRRLSDLRATVGLY